MPLPLLKSSPRAPEGTRTEWEEPHPRACASSLRCPGRTPLPPGSGPSLRGLLLRVPDGLGPPQTLSGVVPPDQGQKGLVATSSRCPAWPGGAGLPGRSRPRPPPRTPGPPRAGGEGVCSPAPRRRVRRAQTRPGVRPAGGDPRCGREARCASPRPPARCVAWAPVIHLAVPAGPAPASRQLPHPTDSL